MTSLAQAIASKDSSIYYQFEKESRNNQVKDDNYQIIKHIIDNSTDVKQDMTIIANKHGLIKANISKIVQHILDTKNPSQQVLLDLYEISRNKIYLEGQYAKIVLLLSKYDPSKLLDVNIDTIQLDRYEKLVFILQQLECLLKVEQFNKVELLAKKVNKNALNDHPAENKTYYTLMAKYYLAIKDYTELGATYATLYKITKDPVDLKNCFYSFFSKYSMDQIHHLRQLITWDHPFKSFLKQVVGNELVTENISFPNELLQSRTQEHNVRVMSLYYYRIHLSHMASLLKLPMDQLEQIICELVTNKTITCKIDRLTQIVTFEKPQHTIGAWTTNVDNMLKCIDQVSHLMTTEEMFHKIHKVEQS